MKTDKNNPLPSALNLDRREFLVTSILAGAFALAVQPIQAQTRVITDSNGLTAGEVKIPVSGGAMPAYRAMPDKKNNGKKATIIILKTLFVIEKSNGFSFVGWCSSPDNSAVALSTLYIFSSCPHL